MKITRLQLVLLLLVVAGIGVGGYSWYKTNGAPAFMKRPASNLVTIPPKTSEPAPIAATPAPATAPAKLDDAARRKQLAQLIANVGESYRLLSTGGEIPAIAQPLRAAKTALAAGKLDEAQVSAETAQKACKEFRKTSFAGTYQIAKGDTLWTIAQLQTPVRHGAGWVGLWKANKRLIKDFDQIEVGWNLVIPAKAAEYATPYWKPRLSTQTAKNSVPQLVDLRELPVLEEEVLVAELPVIRPPSEFEAEAFRWPATVLPLIHYTPPVVP